MPAPRKWQIRITPEGKYRALLRKWKRVAGQIRNAVARKQEELAHIAAGLIKGGIERGRSGWGALHPMTIAGKGHRRPLVDTGTFLKSIAAWREGDWWYAGLMRGVQTADGKDMRMVAAVQEYGASIKVTDKMRDFFAGRGFPLKKETVAVFIPPRPWFAPAKDEFEKVVEKEVQKLGRKAVEGMKV